MSTSVSDECVESLAELPQLESLVFIDCAITDAGLKRLASFDSLTSLALNGTEITDDGMNYLRNNNTLIGLSVSDTNVTDEGVAAVCDAGILVRLAVSNTTVTDRGLSHVSRLANLQWFFAAGTQITDEDWFTWLGCATEISGSVENGRHRPRARQPCEAHITDEPGLEEHEGDGGRDQEASGCFAILPYRPLVLRVAAPAMSQLTTVSSDCQMALGVRDQPTPDALGDLSRSGFWHFGRAPTVPLQWPSSAPGQRTVTLDNDTSRKDQK